MSWLASVFCGAERSLRPLVVARKVWGGTRSNQGLIDAMRRATLIDTWRVRGLNPFLEVKKLLLPLNSEQLPTTGLKLTNVGYNSANTSPTLTRRSKTYSRRRPHRRLAIYQDNYKGSQ